MPNDLKDLHLAFIGCGVMGESMIAGLLRKKLVDPVNITASHPREARRAELAERHGIAVFDKNREAVESIAGKQNSAVVLCIKPQRLDRVLNDLKGGLHPDQMVISIVAGATIEKLAGELGTAKVVRAMPNTPSQIGAGITAWTCTVAVEEMERGHVRELLSALGKELFVETENMIDMATSLSATGPTYIFMVMEALTDAGVHLGFSRDMAKGAGPGNDARLGQICDRVAQTPRRTPQHGHLTWRHHRRGYLPNGKGDTENRSVKGCVCSIQAGG